MGDEKTVRRRNGFRLLLDRREIFYERETERERIEDERFVVRDRRKHRSALPNGRLRSFRFQRRLHHDVHEVIAGK